MDPASATVVSIGLAASLTTLLGLVVDSSKTLYDLQRKLRHAPKSVLRLQQDLQDYGALLFKIQTRFREKGDIDVPQDWQELWQSFASQMEQEMEDFKAIIARYGQKTESSAGKKV